MSNLEKAIKQIHERFDSPALRTARGIQEKLDVFQSPLMREYLDSIRRIQELTTSPALRAITDIQDNFRLTINPQFQSMLEQNERMKDIIDPSGIGKTARDLSTVSKWTSSIDTPASVFRDVSNFSKIIEQVTAPMQELFNYQEVLNRIQSFSIDQPFIDPMFDASFWKSYRYTLIDEEETEPETQIVLLDEGGRIKRLIAEIYRNNQKRFTLEPRDFEGVIAELLRFQQFDVEMTKRTRDGGYDLIAIKNVGEFPVRFLVEIKRNAKSRKIGVGIVRGFRDVINTNGANKGIIVTSSYFSTDAKKDRLQNKPYLLDFRDHDDVIRWVNQYIN